MQDVPAWVYSSVTVHKDALNRYNRNYLTHSRTVSVVAMMATASYDERKWYRLTETADRNAESVSDV